MWYVSYVKAIRIYWKEIAIEQKHRYRENGGTKCEQQNHNIFSTYCRVYVNMEGKNIFHNDPNRDHLKRYISKDSFYLKAALTPQKGIQICF